MTRSQWCLALAKLVSPSFPQDAAQALTDMLPAMRHLDDSLFTADTLADVAMTKRRQSVPAFDEIVRALQDYRRTYLPDPTLRLAAPPSDPGRGAPSPEEVAVVEELLRGYRRECAERELDRINREPRLSPLPDVSLRGEALRRTREIRGVRPVEVLA